MDTVEHLRQLFGYNDWANRRLIVAVKASDSSRCLEVLSHLVLAEREWFERLHGKDSGGGGFWLELTVEECGDIARENAGNYERLLRRFEEEGLDIRCRYFNSKGKQYENTFREILTHVIMHSAIHRGNILIKLRDEGLEPPQTDHIVYLRETKYI